MFYDIANALQTTDDLVELQRKEWDPVLEWFNKKFEIDLQPAVGICGADIPMKARESIRRYLLSYDIWAITGECLECGFVHMVT